MINAVRIAGFLFLFIIVINVASVSFGNELMSDLNAEAKLQKISEDPSRYKTGIGLGVVEHLAIIALAFVLYVAFGHYDRKLGMIWIAARSVEGLILIYNEIRVWELLSIAEKYAEASGVNQVSFVALGEVVLQSKNSGFLLASIFFGIGTMAYSYLFVTHGLVPLNIGRAGIICGFLWSASNGASLVTPSLLILTNVSGLAVLIFEVLLGGWLFLYSSVTS